MVSRLSIKIQNILKNITRNVIGKINEKWRSCNDKQLKYATQMMN